ncbi:MAG: hypothetical protein WAV09_03075 [Minisyncoccia bacterium]
MSVAVSHKAARRDSPGTRITDAELIDAALVDAIQAFQEDVKQMKEKQKAAVAKLRKHIEGDIEYFKELHKPKFDEGAAYQSRIIELLREHYVMQVAVAETTFPIRKLTLFNTWYPMKGVW